MGQDTNRGSDIGRGPQMKSMGVQENALLHEQIKRERLTGQLKKKVTQIEGRHRVGRLNFGGGVTVLDKQYEKDRKDLMDAVALHIPVNETVLTFCGLRSEPNPPVPDFDDSEPI